VRIPAGILKRGGDNAANLLAIRSNVRRKRDTYEADAAEARLRHARSVKALDALEK
jgi:hypothetical protein